MITLIGLTVSKPDHPVLKHVCPLNRMESTITRESFARRSWVAASTRSKRGFRGL